ncbi:Oligopeptide transport ATP-binding protein OppD [bacterium HR32]|jgi:ABC-type glutathione transport system ATPase component|nr:Oligopeptide transport ATP-binding protein OppD [bacterium HR32]
MSRRPVVELQDVWKAFGQRAPVLCGVELRVHPGEVVGLVGPNGAGKSTLLWVAAGLLPVDRGQVLWEGADLRAMSPVDRARWRRHLGYVPQDPFDALPPHRTVLQTVEEPLRIHGIRDSAARTERVCACLEAVGLSPTRFLARYPHELSGGERQRVALARALVLRPRCVLADEPTSMLDFALQVDLVDQIRTLRARLGTSFLYATHDLALAARLCDRVAVLSGGRVVEQGEPAELLREPHHPFTAALAASARRRLGWTET